MHHPLLAQPRRLASYLAVWAAPASLLAAAPLLAEPGRWRPALALALPLCGLYAFACLAAWYPAQANPPGTPVARLLLVHGLAAAFTTSAWIAIGRGWAGLLERWLPGSLAVYARLLPLLLVGGVLLYLLAVAACYVYLVREGAHRAERRALEAQVAAREAELKALRAQMDPHFLFNALNSVSALCGSDPQAARRMLEQLAAFLRGSLELSTSERIALGREVSLAHAFLQIERVRFGDRLRFLSEVDEAAAALQVPPLLLQPLVENALKHGIAHLLDGGTLSIQAKRRRDMLYVVVENPCDPDRPTAPGTALGMENVRRRLAACYGDRALMAVDRKPERFRVELRIPAEEGVPAALLGTVQMP
jgi:two-component system, LytTR family, sensor histidine kinase AlgZ